MPHNVTDRAAEVWEPLVAIADVAGQHWPDTARAAAAHFVDQATAVGASIGTRLLADLRAVFLDQHTDRMATTDILGRLAALEESSWGDLDGRPLDPRRLARELGRYGVRPGPLRIAGTVTKGYQIDGPTGLTDAWTRYLPPVTDDPSPGAVTTVTAITPQVKGYTAGQTRNRNPTGNRYIGYTPCRAPPTRPTDPDPRNRCRNRRTGYAPPIGYALTRHVTAVTAVTEEGDRR
jgi:hypothetical protein